MSYSDLAARRKTFIRLTTQSESDSLLFKGAPKIRVQIFLDAEGVFNSWSDKGISRTKRAEWDWIEPISADELPLPVCMTKAQIENLHEYWSAPGTRKHYDRSPIPRLIQY